MRDPVLLHKAGETPRSIPAIDAPAWIGLGWSVEPQVEKLEPVAPDPVVPSVVDFKLTKRKPVSNAE